MASLNFYFYIAVAFAVIDNVLVIYGGYNDEGVSNLVHAYDPISNTWVRRTRR